MEKFSDDEMDDDDTSVAADEMKVPADPAFVLQRLCERSLIRRNAGAGSPRVSTIVAVSKSSGESILLRGTSDMVRSSRASLESLESVVPLASPPSLSALGYKICSVPATSDAGPQVILRMAYAGTPAT